MYIYTIYTTTIIYIIRRYILENKINPSKTNFNIIKYDLLLLCISIKL